MDDIESILDWSLSPLNFTSEDSTNVTVPVAVEASSAGVSIFLSLFGIYFNLVLARSLFKSTLLASSHRRIIRFFCYFHVGLGVTLSITAICWLFRWLTWVVLPLPTVLFLLFREGVRSSLVWCCLERIIYNRNEKVREDRGGKVIVLLRLAVIAFTIIFTTFVGLYVGESTPDGLFTAFPLVVTLVVTAILPIPMVVVVIFMISRVGKTQKWSQGLVASVRAKKLEQEKGCLRNCIIPLVFFMGICSTLEFVVNYYVPYLDIPATFLIYSAKTVVWPTAQILLQPLLRDDCRMNLFIWRKLQRRSSEARVRTIMNKESQESIITNFKMIGILSE